MPAISGWESARHVSPPVARAAATARPSGSSRDVPRSAGGCAHREEAIVLRFRLAIPPGGAETKGSSLIANRGAIARPSPLVAEIDSTCHAPNAPPDERRHRSTVLPDSSARHVIASGITLMALLVPVHVAPRRDVSVGPYLGRFRLLLSPHGRDFPRNNVFLALDACPGCASSEHASGESTSFSKSSRERRVELHVTSLHAPAGSSGRRPCGPRARGAGRASRRALGCGESRRRCGAGR